MARHIKTPSMADAHRMTQPHQTQAKLARHLGGVAREARTAARLTQADVAERIGIATEVYGRLERGGMLPSVPTLRKLCSVLRADANALLGLNSGVPFVSVDEPTRDKWEESPRVRWVLRMLRQLKPNQFSIVGQLARTFAKSNTGVQADAKDAGSKGQNT